jgi:hypothetical protein
MARRTRIGFITLAIATAMGLSLALPAAAATRFGSRLATDEQPQPWQWCDAPNDEPPHPNCTWVLNEAYVHSASIDPLEHARAPRKGYIDKIRISSCVSGSFRLQIAKVKRSVQEAKVVRNGPIVHYNGDPDSCDDDVYTVNTINIPNLRVYKGEFLAVKAKKVGFLRCNSGGDRTYQFDPPLAPGGSYRSVTDTDGCWLLLEAVMA